MILKLDHFKISEIRCGTGLCPTTASAVQSSLALCFPLIKHISGTELSEGSS